MDNNQSIPHYYGDIVRIIFVACAVFLLFGLPTMTNLFNIPVFISIIGIVLLGSAAGITNPVRKFSLQLNAFLSLFFMVSFAYLAWYGYDAGYGFDVQFANQIAAIAFLIASYFSIKSLRGTKLPK